MCFIGNATESALHAHIDAIDGLLHIAAARGDLVDDLASHRLYIGDDLLAARVHHVRPEMHIIWIVFAINAIVAALSYFVYDFKIEPVILCLIYCFLSRHVGDTMIKGFKEAVKFEIVTDKPEELSAELLKHMKHGVTEIPAVGGFTHSNKTLLICVVNRHQIVAFQRIIQQFPGSFAYLSSVKETMGNFAHIKR